VALALAVLGAIWLTSRAAGHRPDADADYLIVPHRNRVSVCVGGAGRSEITDQDIERVRDALDVGLNSLETIPSAFADFVIEEGCPPAIPLEGERYLASDSCCLPSILLESASEASPHVLFVYLVGDPLYETSFGDLPFMQTKAERVCTGDTCEVQTLALYVTDAISSAGLADALLFTFGLHRRQTEPEPTIDWASCLRGTPNPWCETLDRCEERPHDVECTELWREAERQLDSE
jgi:hypothetical protein